VSVDQERASSLGGRIRTHIFGLRCVSVDQERASSLGLWMFTPIAKAK